MAKLKTAKRLARKYYREMFKELPSNVEKDYGHFFYYYYGDSIIGVMALFYAVDGFTPVTKDKTHLFLNIIMMHPEERITLLMTKEQYADYIKNDTEIIYCKPSPAERFKEKTCGWILPFEVLRFSSVDEEIKKGYAEELNDDSIPF